MPTGVLQENPVETEQPPNMLPLILVTLLAAVAPTALSLPEPEAGLPVSELHRLRRQATGGKCETSADCIAPNVCSKWGWCQWTTIYGKDGPSQGADAPGGGRSGQCVTSADCASRVPYCSVLGFCHGGRLPFDEEQLEIPEDEDRQGQGYVNNDPVRNNPVFRDQQGGSRRQRPRQDQPRRSSSSSSGRRTNQRDSSSSDDAVAARINDLERQQGNNRRNGPQHQQRRQQQQQQQQQRRQQQQQQQQRRGGSGSSDTSSCPGSDYGDCVLSACGALKDLAGGRVYQACEEECQQRCQ